MDSIQFCDKVNRVKSPAINISNNNNNIFHNYQSTVFVTKHAVIVQNRWWPHQNHHRVLAHQVAITLSDFLFYY